MGGGARGRLLLAVAAMALLLVAGGHAAAQAMRCGITNVTAVSFGAYDTLSPSPLDSAGYVEYRCDGVGAGGMIVIELGRGRDVGFHPRRMRQRGDRLEYNLYLDAARTLVWGDGSRGTSSYQARPPDGVAVTVPIYGRIPPLQAVTPGPYSDQIVLVVQF